MSNRKRKKSTLKRKRSDGTSLNEHTHTSNKKIRTTANSARAYTNCSDEHKHSIKQVQTLSQPRWIFCAHMCATEDMTAALLLIGLAGVNGDVSIYRTPLSQTQPIHFNLLKRFHAHSGTVNAVHMHPAKQLFVSASNDSTVKIWSVKTVTSPLLIKAIEHPDIVYCARYSISD